MRADTCLVHGVKMLLPLEVASGQLEAEDHAHDATDERRHAQRRMNPEPRWRILLRRQWSSDRDSQPGNYYDGSNSEI